LEVKDFVNSDLLKKSIREHFDSVNNNLENNEKVQKYNILKVPFSVEGGELNPIDNLCRENIYKKYESEIELLYSGN
jgi:long-subunit acyl-CoA synthetase (AMP-forming)